MNILLWILAFFFGYTIKKEGENLNLFKTNSRMVLEGDGKKISNAIVHLNEQLAKIKKKRVYVADFKKEGAETNDTGRIQRAVTALSSGDTLVFEPDTIYDTTFISYVISIAGKNVEFEGKNSIIRVSDKGVSITAANSFKMRGVVIERKRQAVWNSDDTGLWIFDINNVDVEDNEIFGFTDSIGVGGRSKNVSIRHNILHHCGQEPIAVRASCDFVLVENNECFKHLGDGILVKGAVNITIRHNKIHTPIKDTDADYISWLDPNLPEGPPGAGGGITCNPEDGGIGARNMTICDNKLIGVMYGIGLLGVEVTKITDNYMKDIYYGNGIVIDNKPYRSQNYPSKNFFITGNHIENLMSTKVVFTGIRVNTGTVKVDDGYISGNIVIPNGNHDGIIASGNMQLVGNTIDQFRKGIRLSSGAKAIGNTVKKAHTSAIQTNSMDIQSDTLVIGNKINSDAPMYIGGNDNTIVNNDIFYTGAWWAIMFRAGSTGNKFDNKVNASNNQRIGGADGDFRNKNTIIDKVGKGKFVISGDGVSTVKTIPHGLGIIPVWVQVQPFSGDAGIAGIKYFLADSTNINVYFNNALPAGTNNITLMWKAES
ncbi:right-handed parallel beta-helix repeat-containing protein [Bacillaceae bacterium OS4b]|nr:right-handed parallel beta-helix repeat-containing protein [Bacillaceae bacterium OS4b]